MAVSLFIIFARHNVLVEEVMVIMALGKYSAFFIVQNSHPELVSIFQVVHDCLELSFPRWRNDLSTLPTRKLLIFLSFLNEISGGCEKIALVSGSF